MIIVRPIFGLPKCVAKIQRARQSKAQSRARRLSKKTAIAELQAAFLDWVWSSYDAHYHSERGEAFINSEYAAGLVRLADEAWERLWLAHERSFDLGFDPIELLDKSPRKATG
jgi:hypothetical protein